MPTEVNATINNDELVEELQKITNNVDEPTGSIRFLGVDTDGTKADFKKASPIAIATNLLTKNGTELPVKRAVINTATSGDQTIVAAVTGNKILVISIDFVVDGTVTLTWKSGSTAISGAKAYSRTELPGDKSGFNPIGWYETVAGQALVLGLSASIGVRGALQYVEVP